MINNLTDPQRRQFLLLLGSLASGQVLGSEPAIAASTIADRIHIPLTQQYGLSRYRQTRQFDPDKVVRTLQTLAYSVAQQHERADRLLDTAKNISSGTVPFETALPPNGLLNKLNTQLASLKDVHVMPPSYDANAYAKGLARGFDGVISQSASLALSTAGSLAQNIAKKDALLTMVANIPSRGDGDRATNILLSATLNAAANSPLVLS